MSLYPKKIGKTFLRKSKESKRLRKEKFSSYQRLTAKERGPKTYRNKWNVKICKDEGTD